MENRANSRLWARVGAVARGRGEGDMVSQESAGTVLRGYGGERNEWGNSGESRWGIEKESVTK